MTFLETTILLSFLLITFKNMKTLILCCAALITGLASTQAQTEVTFYTTEGDFIVELADSLAPITAGNFLSLVQDEFYDDVIFHRVIEGFMIQGGDPTGTGWGGPGYSIEDEFHELLSNVEASISMANSGPNTGGSQFFINVTNNTYLDFDQSPLEYAHPVFGTVVSGYEVVEAISEVATNAQDRPITDVVMDSLRVTTFGPLGISDRIASFSMDITVFPNPSSDHITIAVDNESIKHLNLEIIDIQGRLVFQSVLRNKSTQIDVAHLEAGTYLVHVSNNSVQGRKILVVK